MVVGSSQSCVGPCVPYTRLHSQVWISLWMAKKLGVGFFPLNSEDKMFHKAVAAAEKILFLDPASQNCLTDMWYVDAFPA